MRKYILGIILTLFVSLSSVFISDTKALDSDYKNNLLKVDVSQNKDGSYKIDLFTQKPYNEPIRVRKKSDTSYYVLLPETYHSITSVGTTGDVNKVDVKLYPYAGQDLNNGYTKINIQTNKPITISTNVKTAGGQVPVIDSKKLAQLDKAFDSKPVYTPKKDTARPYQPKQVQQKPVVAMAEDVRPVQKPVVKPVQKQPARNDVNTEIQKPVRITHASNSDIEIVTKPKTQEPADEKLKVKDKQEPVSLEEVTDADVTADDAKLEQEAQEQGLTELATGEDEEIPAMSKKQRVKQLVKSAMKMTLDNVLLLIAVIFLIVALALLATKPKPKKEAAVQSREDTVMSPEGLGALNKAAQNTAPAVEAQPAVEPAVQEQPVETYKPAATFKPLPEADEYDVYEAGHVEPAPDMDVAASDYTETVQEQAETVDVQSVEAEPVEEHVEPVQEYAEPVQEPAQDEDAADVLAAESFGDGRGLCLVNYDGDIALVGYIGEEIFVIQNFGKITLINPNIQVRVAEQNDDSTVYIVKAANSKLMVKETKTFIGLEMVM